MSKATRRKNGTFRSGVSGNPSGVRKDGAERPRSMDLATRVDGWASALTGIGSQSHDKRMSHHFRRRAITYQESIEMWSGDDLARRAIESVPAECFRQGYEVVIADEGKYDDLKEELEARMKELRVDEVVERAFQYERAYGGAAILIGADDTQDLSKPLDPRRVKSVDWLTVLEPVELFPSTYYDDPRSAKYGEPEMYQLASYGMGRTGVSDLRQAPPVHQIHESRLIVFGGIRVSRYQNQSNSTGGMWGESILSALYDVLRDFNVAWHSAGIIATDFAQSVISIEDLMTLVVNNPKALADRMAAIELGRSTARAIIIDTKEKYERQSTSLAGLPDLLDRLSTRLSACIDMPLTLLMGQSPKGLGNEGDSDVRFYYDRIRGVQMRKIGPILRFIASLIMGTLGAKIPKKWGIRFNELWQLSDQERAESRLTQARADAMMIKMGVLFPDEVRKSRYKGEYSFETQIDETKEAPGTLELIPSGKGYAPGVAPAGAAWSGPAPAGAGPQVPAAVKLPRNSHGVAGYTRKNPTRKAGIDMPKEGGDVTPTTRDHADVECWQDSVMDAVERQPGVTAEILAALEHALAAVAEVAAVPESDEVDEYMADDLEGRIPPTGSRVK